MISKKYIDYIQARSHDRNEFVKKQVVNAVNILNRQGIYPSRRKVEELLKMPGVVKARAIQLVWKHEKEKLKQEGRL